MIVIVYSERSVGPQVETMVDGLIPALDWVADNPIDNQFDGIYEFWEGEQDARFFLVKTIGPQQSRDLGA